MPSHGGWVIHAVAAEDHSSVLLVFYRVEQRQPDGRGPPGRHPREDISQNRYRIGIAQRRGLVAKCRSDALPERIVPSWWHVRFDPVLVFQWGLDLSWRFGVSFVFLGNRKPPFGHIFFRTSYLHFLLLARRQCMIVGRAFWRPFLRGSASLPPGFYGIILPITIRRL